MQFQEDGLPVLNFGDIAFGTADTFVRADYNIDRVELVRGGSASTATVTAPTATSPGSATVTVEPASKESPPAKAA